MTVATIPDSAGRASVRSCSPSSRLSPFSQLSLEARLVVLASSRQLVPAREADLIALLSRAPQWPKVYEIAESHRVGPRVFRTLDTLAPHLVPDEFRGRWQQATRQNLANNLFLVTELWELTELLGRHGIRIISFKGPVLAAMLHDTIALRPFTDLDLVVETPELAQQAKNILIERGYTLPEPMNPTEEHFFLKTQSEFHIINPRKQVFIDLHWKIFYAYFSYPFDVGEAFSRLMPVSVANRTLPTFCPEDQALILSAHSTRHLWENLGMIADFADLLHTFPRLDWAATLRKANVLGGRRMLFTALYLVQALYGCPLSAELRRLIRRDVPAQKLGHEVITRLFGAGVGSGPDDPDILTQLLFQLRSRERLRDRLRYLALGLFLPSAREYGAFPLPEPLFPLYGLLRPLRLLRCVLIT
jgi:hypothetical protein